MPEGSLKGLQLVVSDIVAAHRQLVDKGVGRQRSAGGRRGHKSP